MSESIPSDYYGSAPDSSSVPAALPKDTRTIESIIEASYACISGAAGVPRAWDRMFSLFLPEAHSIRTGRLPDGSTGYRIMRNAEYRDQMNDWLVENGFFEREIHRVVERYGNIAQVFSTYESRHKEDDPQPFMRGINSFQLLYDGRRWWIVNILWQHESPDMPLPPQYLP